MILTMVLRNETGRLPLRFIRIFLAQRKLTFESPLVADKRQDLVHLVSTKILAIGVTF